MACGEGEWCMHRKRFSTHWRYDLGLGLMGVSCATLLALSVVLTPSPTYAITPCGGEGQRACCFHEGLPCNSDLRELTGLCSTADPDCRCQDLLGVEVYSNGRCISRSSCGGLGERACCFGSTACEDGNDEVTGCVGDCTCNSGDGNSSGMCEGDFNIAEPETGRWFDDSFERECPLAGYADLHTHLFAELAHGGKVFSGKVYDESEGIESALSTQDDDDRHGPHTTVNLLGPSDPIGAGTQDGAGSNPSYPNSAGALSNEGPDLFNGWPTWSSTTHQQMYYKWLKRAYQGGLRLIVMLAVNNLALCKSTNGSTCDNTMYHIDKQLEAVKKFETFIQDHDGGWFVIVTSPQQAREVISQGKLAVVLGIEVENLFNCEYDDDDDTNGVADGCPAAEGQSQEDYVTEQVQKYYDLGVRHIFPIHNFDNAFGGPATWLDGINVGNRAIEGHWWQVEECPSTPEGDYGYQVGKFFDIWASFFMNFFGFCKDWIDFPTCLQNESPHGDWPTCNKFGLWPLGDHLIKELMDKGMIIDVDHMSNKSLNQTVELAKARDYPVVATHVQFFQLNKKSIRHERMRTLKQLEDIRNSGGMIAAMLKDDQQDTANTSKKLNKAYTTPLYGPRIADDCRQSSKTFAQMYQYAVDILGAPVAFGSDFNGVAGHVGARFGHQACGANLLERGKQLGEGNQLEYPFDLPGFGEFWKQETGLRIFDYNTNGLATVGQLPDLVADLRGVGLSDTYLTDLFRSAEEYINVWERAEGTFEEEHAKWQAKCIKLVTVEADDACQAEASVADDSLEYVTLEQNPSGPYTGPTTNVFEQDHLVTLTATPELSCDGPTTCKGTVRVVDHLSPTITCPATPAAVECVDGEGSVEFDGPIATDNCNLFASGCVDGERFVKSGDSFPLGTTAVTCVAQDWTGNRSEVCSFEVTVRDTTPPKITCPEKITAECTSPDGAAVKPADATVMDSCGIGVIITPPTPATFSLGTTTLTYSASDAGNNRASCMSDIEVVDTTAPDITCPDDIAVEPETPEGTQVSFIATADDTCDETPTVDCPDSGKIFEVGTTTEVTCTATDDGTSTATDDDNNKSSCRFSVHVYSKEEVVMNLQEDVQQLLDDGDINMGVGNGLLRNLSSVESSLDRNDAEAACDQLQDFIDTTQGQIDSEKLALDDGQPLIDSATNLRSTLACSDTSES
jgi:microsomal dipeptidase-like Zn-dependent dipeptidase